MKYLILVMLMSNFTWSQKLDKHQWKDRIVLIIADKENRELAEQQFDLLSKDKEALIDRKLVLYKCLEDECTFYDWKNKPKSVSMAEGSTGFKIALVGLDGGEKFSSTTIAESDAIFNLVDAMPMRRQELETRKKND